MEQLARSRARRGFQRGLHVRVRGERLTASIYEASRISAAPSLKARMHDEDDGLRITGQVDCLAELTPFTMASIALLGAITIGVGAASGDWRVVAVGLFLVLGFGYLAVMTFRSKAAIKAAGIRTLEKQFFDMFHGPRKPSGR